ncbi:MAG TPA: hypothetical protein VEF06_03375 [Bryobacteraceae bacterium]|nr:hypothetical protein [Bryobacteraceae bacterium]
MGLLQELIGVDSQGAFDFFLENLRDPARTEGLREDELLYVTSVLAHYAQTSRFDTSSSPCMAGLAEVFDHFLPGAAALNDSELLEFGGSQVLLFAGFFRDQMQRRHNVEWYDQIGQSLYERAGQHSGDMRRREFFDHLSESFPVWTIVCRDLNRTLRENRFLLRLN